MCALADRQGVQWCMAVPVTILQKGFDGVFKLTTHVSWNSVFYNNELTTC